MKRLLIAAAIAAIATPTLADHRPGHIVEPEDAEMHNEHGMHDQDGHDHNDHGDHTMHHDGENHQAANGLPADLIAAQNNGGELVVANVLGVVCDFCATAMNKTFAKRREVAATYVDLDAKTLSIAMKPGETLDDKTIEKLVKKAGYKLNGVKRIAAKAASAPDPNNAF